MKHKMSGQWEGSFVYGPEYPDEFYGEQVEFRMFLEEKSDGQFLGYSIDIEGKDVNFERAEINGFIENDFISFTKAYPNFFVIDEMKKKIDLPASDISYTGEFYHNISSFKGNWEILGECVYDHEGNEYVEVFTGTWQMKKGE